MGVSGHIEILAETISTHTHLTRIDTQTETENSMTYEIDEYTSHTSTRSHVAGKFLFWKTKRKRTTAHDWQHQAKKDNNLKMTGKNTLKLDKDRTVMICQCFLPSNAGDLKYEFDVKFIKGDFDALKRNEAVTMTYCEYEQSKYEGMIDDIMGRMMKLEGLDERNWEVLSYGTSKTEADLSKLHGLCGGMKVLMKIPL